MLRMDIFYIVTTGALFMVISHRNNIVPSNTPTFPVSSPKESWFNDETFYTLPVSQSRSPEAQNPGPWHTYARKNSLKHHQHCQHNSAGTPQRTSQAHMLHCSMQIPPRTATSTHHCVVPDPQCTSRSASGQVSLMVRFSRQLRYKSGRLRQPMYRLSRL